MKNTSENKLALVTGSTDGIGKQTAFGLASNGFDVILTGRNEDKGLRVLEELRAKCPKGNHRFFQVDFSSFSSIKSFASRVVEEIYCLDVLVNNIGLYTSKRKMTEDGFESMFAVNYLAPFLVSHLFLEKLKVSGAARIINVTGGAYKFGNIHFDDLNLTKKFGSLKALSQSKLANILFSNEADRRWSTHGIRSISVDPGAAKTPGHQEHSNYLLKIILPIIGTSTEKASKSSVIAASSPLFENSGGIFLDRYGKIQKLNSPAKDLSLSGKLWKETIAILDNTEILEFGN